MKKLYDFHSDAKPKIQRIEKKEMFHQVNDIQPATLRIQPQSNHEFG